MLVTYLFRLTLRLTHNTYESWDLTTAEAR